MSTYRTGNHWGVTIVRETTDHPRWAGTEPQEVEPDSELVAVVVNGDQELAERICRDRNDAWQLVEAIGLLGEATRLRRNGEDAHATWARFDWMVEDFMRRRRDEDAPSPLPDVAYCPTCDLRMYRGTRHPHPLVPSARPVTPYAAEQGSGVVGDRAEALSDSDGSCDGTCREHPGANCPAVS